MESRIRSELEKIEREHQVTIIYACESGSRAWGFPSDDSDYDVRFIYAHEKAWYLSVGPCRDVIECPPGPVLDINGWDNLETICAVPNVVMCESNMRFASSGHVTFTSGSPTQVGYA